MKRFTQAWDAISIPGIWRQRLIIQLPLFSPLLGVEIARVLPDTLPLSHETHRQITKIIYSLL